MLLYIFQRKNIFQMITLKFSIKKSIYQINNKFSMIKKYSNSEKSHSKNSKTIIDEECLNGFQNNFYFISEIISERTLPNGREQLFVSWQGWPKRFNSWVYKDTVMPIDKLMRNIENTEMSYSDLYENQISQHHSVKNLGKETIYEEVFQKSRRRSRAKSIKNKIKKLQSKSKSKQKSSDLDTPSSYENYSEIYNRIRSSKLGLSFVEEKESDKPTSQTGKKQNKPVKNLKEKKNEVRADKANKFKTKNEIKNEKNRKIQNKEQTIEQKNNNILTKKIKLLSRQNKPKGNQQNQKEIQQKSFESSIKQPEKIIAAPQNTQKSNKLSNQVKNPLSINKFLPSEPKSSYNPFTNTQPQSKQLLIKMGDLSDLSKISINSDISSFLGGNGLVFGINNKQRDVNSEKTDESNQKKQRGRPTSNKKELSSISQLAHEDQHENKTKETEKQTKQKSPETLKLSQQENETSKRMQNDKIKQNESKESAMIHQQKLKPEERSNSMKNYNSLVANPEPNKKENQKKLNVFEFFKKSSQKKSQTTSNDNPTQITQDGIPQDKDNNIKNTQINDSLLLINTSTQKINPNLYNLDKSQSKLYTVFEERERQSEQKSKQTFLLNNLSSYSHPLQSHTLHNDTNLLNGLDLQFSQTNVNDQNIELTSIDADTSIVGNKNILTGLNLPQYPQVSESPNSNSNSFYPLNQNHNININTQSYLDQPSNQLIKQKGLQGFRYKQEENPQPNATNPSRTCKTANFVNKNYQTISSYKKQQENHIDSIEQAKHRIVRQSVRVKNVLNDSLLNTSMAKNNYNDQLNKYYRRLYPELYIHDNIKSYIGSQMESNKYKIEDDEVSSVDLYECQGRQSFLDQLRYPQKHQSLIEPNDPINKRGFVKRGQNMRQEAQKKAKINPIKQRQPKIFNKQIANYLTDTNSKQKNKMINGKTNLDKSPTAQNSLLITAKEEKNQPLSYYQALNKSSFAQRVPINQRQKVNQQLIPRNQKQNFFLSNSGKPQL